MQYIWTFILQRWKTTVYEFFITLLLFFYLRSRNSSQAMILNGKIPKDASVFWVRLQGVAIMGVAIFLLDKSQGRSFNSSSSVFYSEKSLLWKFGWGRGSEIKCSLLLAEVTWYCGEGHLAGGWSVGRVPRRSCVHQDTGFTQGRWAEGSQLPSSAVLIIKGPDWGAKVGNRY